MYYLANSLPDILPAKSCNRYILPAISCKSLLSGIWRGVIHRVD